jgi:leader peptidase (prepilin peptidase)/N-methyltransferase
LFPLVGVAPLMRLESLSNHERKRFIQRFPKDIIMNNLHLLLEVPALFYAGITLLGLMVGSFLNVVIHRLPIMMEREWRRDCEAFLELPDSTAQNAPCNLCLPGSACPHCGHEISALENIPVLSYLFLRGRCAQCRTPIGLRYPLVEALTALLSVTVAWRFGPDWQTAAALVLCWSLIALAFIDLDHQLLPDAITQPLLWLGLGVNLFGVLTDQTSSLIGAMSGYLLLWLVYQAHRFIRKKEGMGHGDFKLLAALGAWLGWQILMPLVFIATVLTLLVTAATLGRRAYHQPIPFGPFLAIAGLLVMLWGHEMLDAYWNYVLPQPEAHEQYHADYDR